jgi:DNA-directed RNA polymerase delta subunit
MPERISATDYDTVLAELYAKRDEFEVSINTILFLKGSGSAVASSIATNGAVKTLTGGAIPSNAFFSLSLVDAAKKCIELKQAKLTLQEIVKGLAEGGMPPQKPGTVYAALRRRESMTGDILKVDDEWGLKEWFSGISTGRTAKTAKTKKSKKKKAAKKTRAKAEPEEAKKSKPEAKGNKLTSAKPLSIVDASYKILSEANVPLHAEILVEKLNADHGKNTNAKSIAATLPGDSTKRFFNTGNNTWALESWRGTDKLQPRVAAATG